jgi:hypothetical protein
LPLPPSLVATAPFYLTPARRVHGVGPRSRI